MGIFDRLFQKRAIPTSAIAIVNPGAPQSMPKNYDSFAAEGYQKNVIAYRCIERNADSVANLPVCLKKKTLGAADEEIYNHPVLELLRHPNPMQSYASFVKSFVGYFTTSGNDYIHAVGPSPTQPPVELWHLRPDCIKIVPGQYNLPLKYIYQKKGSEVVFPVDPIDGSCSVRHLKTFHPRNDLYGMSPIEAAAFSLDQHNAVGMWNLSLLQNSARPSGMIIIKDASGTPGGALEPNQRENLIAQIKEQYASASNAGKIMVGEGGMEWKEMGFSPQDMNWIEGKNTSARDIALALGNPPQMLGIPGDNTYSNYEQAKLAYYIDTVIPLGKFWLEHLNSWLIPSFGDESLCLEIDENKIEALEPMRKEKWTQVQQATFISINEKRERLGYGKYDTEEVEDAADMIYVPPGLVPLGEEPEETEDDLQGEEDNGEDTSDYIGSDNDDDEQGTGEDDETSEGDGDTPKFAYFNGKKQEIKSTKGKRQYIRAVKEKRNRLAEKMKSQIRKVWKAERDSLIAALKSTHSWSEVEHDLVTVLHKSQPKFEKVMKENIRNVMMSFGKDVLKIKKDLKPYSETKNDDTKFNQFVDGYINNHVGEKITGIYGNTKKRVLKRLRDIFLEAMQDGNPGPELVKEVRDIYSEFTIGRANTIVVTETGMAQNEAQLNAAKLIDIPGMKKTWLSEQVERTRQFPRDSTNHWDMNDVTIDINDKFHVPSDSGGDDMDGPGDRSAPPEQVINCHCVLVFGTGD